MIKIEIFAEKGIVDRNTIRTTIEHIFLAEKKIAQTITIIITDDTYVQKLNSRFLNRNSPTDVIAFEGNGEFLGEVYVSYDRAEIQAREYGISIQEELHRLIIHGVLHLLGYEHPEIVEVQEKYLKNTLT